MSGMKSSTSTKPVYGTVLFVYGFLGGPEELQWCYS